MELDTFISQTLNSIIKAVSESQKEAAKHGAIINPSVDQYKSNITGTIRQEQPENTIYRRDGKDGRRFLDKIDFDIAVTAGNEAGSNVDGGLRIQVLSFGAAQNNKEVSQTTSRLSFSINVALPFQEA